MAKKITIVGTVPPPVGGVSVHLSRLLSFLRGKGQQVIFCDYKRGAFSLVKSLFASKVVHTNFTNKKIRFIHTLAGRILARSIVITFHGKYDFENRYDRWSLKLASKCCLLNESSFLAARRHKKASRLSLISSFVPPDDESDDDELSQIAIFGSQYEYTVCSNASQLAFNEQGEDIYGIDLIMELAKQYSNIGFVISDPAATVATHYKQYGTLPSNVYFKEHPHSFVAVIKLCTLHLRPTRSDGDSISVKESLYFGKKTLASDCVSRPDGCSVFQSGSVESLKSALMATLEQPAKENYTIINGAEQLLAIYSTLN